MRIEKGISNIQNTEVTITRAVKPPVETKKPSIPNNISYQEMTHRPQAELTMDERQWIDLIEKANKALSGGTRSFEFSIHEATKQIVVKVIDSESHEVIREIPNEKILDMVAKMWEMSGMFVDERR